MTKPTLNWEFDDDRDDIELGTSGRPHRGVPWGKIIAWLMFAVGILAAAGVGGFVYGRFQSSTTAARADLQAAIDVETWAWQGGNRQLFQSTIDPAARPDWRADLERQFESAGRDVRAVTLVSFRLLGDEMAQVDVDVFGQRGLQQETRYYRLVNGQWRRTSPNRVS